jgi:hypothetical protein
LLDEHVLPCALEGLDDGLGDLGGVGKNDAHPLRPLEQLDHDRRTPQPLDRREEAYRVMYERRQRHAHVVSAQQLKRAQLVARHADGL